MRRAVYGLVIIFFVLRYDIWLMDNPQMLLGLPIGLAYHVLYTAATIAVLFLLVRFAWPEEPGATQGADGEASP